MEKKSKQERRLVQIQKILRKRNYGFKKVVNTYNDQIVKAVFTKSDVDAMAREMYKQMSGRSTESLAGLYDKLNERLARLFRQIPNIFDTLTQQGSQKVFTKDAVPLKLKIPDYKNTIKKFTNSNIKLVTDITDAQRKVMIDEISKGIKEGKPYKAIGEQIVNKVEGISKMRAERIARNESHLAHNEAMEKTMKENGFEKYQWITAGDNRVSPICQSLHRQIFEFGKTGKMNWRGADGKIYVISKSPKPIHDTHINCRCVKIVV